MGWGSAAVGLAVGVLAGLALDGAAGSHSGDSASGPLDEGSHVRSPFRCVGMGVSPSLRERRGVRGVCGVFP